MHYVLSHSNPLTVDVIFKCKLESFVDLMLHGEIPNCLFEKIKPKKTSIDFEGQILVTSFKDLQELEHFKLVLPRFLNQKEDSYHFNFGVLKDANYSSSDST